MGIPILVSLYWIRGLSLAGPILATWTLRAPERYRTITPWRYLKTNGSLKRNTSLFCFNFQFQLETHDTIETTFTLSNLFDLHVIYNQCFPAQCMLPRWVIYYRCSPNACCPGEMPWACGWQLTHRRQVRRPYVWHYFPVHVSRRLHYLSVGYVSVAPNFYESNDNIWYIRQQKLDTCEMLYSFLQERFICKWGTFCQNLTMYTYFVVCMHPWNGSALLHIMACRVCGSMPSPEPIMTYC